MRIHIVQRGDTLWKIAKEYGISFEDLKRLNVHLANPDYIVPGMEIILPEKGHKVAPTHKEAPTHSKPPSTQHKKEEVKKESVKPPAKPVQPIQPVQPVRPVQPPHHQMPPIIIEPQLIHMPVPQAPIMWVQQPVEVNWHQQLMLPQMEQPMPPPAPPVVQPPVMMPPQMPMIPHCSSCQQPIMQAPMWQMCPPHHMHGHHMMHEHHHHMQQEQPCEMPYMPEGPGAHQPLFFLESSSNPSSSCKDHHNPAPPCCGQNQQHGQPQWPQMGMDVGGMHAQQWQYDPCCHQQYPGQPVFPWAPPHFFPGGMTPYR